MKLTVPTWLTLLRIVLIPVLVVVFYLPYKWTNFAAAAVFILAAVTDWLDGWIARRYHQYSAFGAFLDPVADKLMVAVALFLIVQGHPTPWMAFWASVIVGREIAVSALREWMAELGQRATVKVATIGKVKTGSKNGMNDVPLETVKIVKAYRKGAAPAKDTAPAGTPKG